MSDPTLIQCEKELIKLKGVLKHPEAVRRGLLHLQHYLAFLQQNHIKAEPYVLRLEGDLPNLKDARLLIGTDPELLWNLYKSLSQLGEGSVQLMQSSRYYDFLLQIRQHLIMLLAFVGELQGIISVIRNRFDTPLIAGRTDQALTVAFMDRRELLTKVLDDPGINDDLKKQIILILNFWKERTETRRPTIFIPVQEEGDYGLLRRISLDVIERHDLPYDTIRTDVALVGADSSKYELSEIPVTVARNQLQKITQHQREIYYKGLLHFELGHILHDGRSVHVAMALLILTGILKNQDHQDIYFPRNGVSFTGELSENGTLLPVDDGSIRAKVHAAFFSWIDMLAVPASQVDQFIDVRDELRQKYPNRKLDIHPVHQFEDVIYDRRLTQYRHISKVNKAVRYAWKNKLGAIGITTILILLTIVGRLVFGPLDKNPAFFEVERETIILYNKYNQETLRIQWDELMAFNYHKLKEFGLETHRNIGLFDLFGTGRLDLVIGRQPNGYQNWDSGFITAINGITGEILWDHQLDFDLDYPNKPESGSNFMTTHIDMIVVNNKPRLMFTIRDRMYFPSIIFTADPKTGLKDPDYYVHSGVVEVVLLLNISDDGLEEIVISGHANYANRSFIAVLNINELRGHGPTTDEYILNGLERGREQHYLTLPKTVVGNALGKRHNRPQVRTMTYIRKSEELYIGFFDILRHETNIPPFDQQPAPAYYLYADFSLNVRHISTSDDYDAAVNRLHQDGLIDIDIDADYFRRYINDEIKYYEDGNWVRLSERRINQVAAIDSSPPVLNQSAAPVLE